MKASVPVKANQGKTDFFERSLRSLRDDVDSMFGRFFSDNGFHMWPHEVTFPALDVVDNKKHVKVKAEIPGMDADDIDLSVHDGLLTIKGEKKEEKEEEGDDFIRHETSYGSFERTISLPEGTDESKVDASFKNGVLKITFGKKKGAEHPSKKIKIKAS